MAGIQGPFCKDEVQATAAASAMASMKAPKGMKVKISVTGFVKQGDQVAALVSVEYEPEVENITAPEAANDADARTGDGKGEGDKDGSSKTSEAKDQHSLNAAQAKGLDASLTDPSVIAAMEQLPDPDQNLLVAEVQNAGPQSAEAVAMAEDMKTEFNDRPQDILVVSNSSTTPEQHASNEAHNQRELDAEETRREAAMANAAQSQKEALSPDPVT